MGNSLTYSRMALTYNAKIYLRRIEELLEIPIKFIGVGAERDSIICIE